MVDSLSAQVYRLKTGKALTLGSDWTASNGVFDSGGYPLATSKYPQFKLYINDDNIITGSIFFAKSYDSKNESSSGSAFSFLDSTNNKYYGLFGPSQIFNTPTSYDDESFFGSGDGFNLVYKLNERESNTVSLYSLTDSSYFEISFPYECDLLDDSFRNFILENFEKHNERRWVKLNAGDVVYKTENKQYRKLVK